MSRLRMVNHVGLNDRFVSSVRPMAMEALP
jgi:hypothetical protein